MSRLFDLFIPAPPDAPDSAIPKEDCRRGRRLAYLAQATGLIGHLFLWRGGVTLFALRFGAGPLEIAFFDSSYFLFAVLKPMAAAFVERHGKRRFLVPCWTISAVMLALLGGVPFLSGPFGNDVARIAIVLIVLLYVLAMGTGSSAWFPLLRDIVPAHMLGRFFARLRLFWSLAGVVALELARHYLAGEPPTWKFGLLFVSMGLIALIRPWAIWHIPERPTSTEEHHEPIAREAWRTFVSASRNPVFIYMILSVVLQGFLRGQWIAYMKTNLGFSDGQTVLASNFFLIGSVAAFALLGRFTDKRRSYWSLFVGDACLVPVQVGWVLLALGLIPVSLTLLCALFLLTGLSFGIWGLGWTKWLFKRAPKRPAVFMGFLDGSRGLAYALSSFAGGAALMATQGATFTVAGIATDSYGWLFTLNAVALAVPLAMLALLLTGRLHERKA